MATAQSYQVNVDSPAIPDANGYGASWTGSDFPTTGKSWWSKLLRGLTGVDEEQQYQNMLTANNRAYEQALLKEQRAYEEYVRNREYEREDTKMQRMIKDMKAAGINPFYALQGGISGSTAQGQPAGNGNFSSGSSAKSKDDKSTSGAISGLLLAVAKVVASL